MKEPITIAGQGHFFTGLREHSGPAGVSVYGTHVEWQAPRSVRDNIVLVHGGGGQALDMLTTPDGREGWATLFLRDGFAVYTVDRPGMGRSPYHPDIYGDFGPPATYGSFVASFAGPSAGGLPVAIVTSECSGFGPSCSATASFLRECGAEVTELRLAELGIHGNGHAMMLERNNAEIAALITDWIGKQL